MSYGPTDLSFLIKGFWKFLTFKQDCNFPSEYTVQSYFSSPWLMKWFFTLFFRQYGDHLYNKGDNATAIDNYIKTIGHLEPSYVIKRFLDAHKINFLTAYLQALHKQGLANEDHTTLLLNCYTKLKDQNKLDEFIFKGTLC